VRKERWSGFETQIVGHERRLFKGGERRARRKGVGKKRTQKGLRTLGREILREVLWGGGRGKAGGGGNGRTKLAWECF